MTCMKGDDIMKATPFVCEADSNTEASLEELSAYLGGVTIVAKGETDHIIQPMWHSKNILRRSNDNEIEDSKVVKEVSESSLFFLHRRVKISKGNSPRRCGGLGDILAGTLAVFQHWFNLLQTDSQDQDNLMRLKACEASCILVRLASLKAYYEKGRGMTAPDVVEILSKVIQEIDFSKDNDTFEEDEEVID